MASAPTCSPEISLGRYLRFCASRAVAPQLVDAQVGVRAVGEPDRGRAAADLLHGDAVLEVAEPRAAVLLLHRDAVQAHVAELRPQVRAGTRSILSISAASGAISSAVKPRTLARSWSAVSPRSKLSEGKSLGIMGRVSLGVCSLASARRLNWARTDSMPVVAACADNAGGRVALEAFTQSSQRTDIGERCCVARTRGAKERQPVTMHQDWGLVGWRSRYRRFRSALARAQDPTEVAFWNMVRDSTQRRRRQGLPRGLSARRLRRCGAAAPERARARLRRAAAAAGPAPAEARPTPRRSPTSRPATPVPR